MRLTKDHVASCEEEQVRIESVGGKVEFGRVADQDGDGVLQVSRGLGNWDMAPSFIPEPHLHEKVVDLDDDDNQFVVMASDGLWDVFDDQEAIDFVATGLERGDDPRTCAALLTGEAVSVRGTTDDTTVVVVVLCTRMYKGGTKENGRVHGSGRSSTNHVVPPPWVSPEKDVLFGGQPPPRQAQRPSKKARRAGCIKMRYMGSEKDDEVLRRGGEEDDNHFL